MFGFKKECKINPVDFDRKLPALKPSASVRTIKVQELIRSELEFIYYLKLATNYYLSYIQCKLQNAKKNSELRSAISPDLLEKCFGKFNSISMKHQGLATRLKNRWTHWSSTEQIGDILADFFQASELSNIYLNYVSNIKIANMELAKSYDKHTKPMMKLDEAIRKLMIKNKESLSPGVIRLVNMKSLMIKPLHRLHRYENLLRDIIALTDKSHIDFTNLNVAHKATKALAERVGGRLFASSSRDALDLKKEPIASVSKSPSSEQSLVKPVESKDKQNSIVKKSPAPKRQFSINSLKESLSNSVMNNSFDAVLKPETNPRINDSFS